MENETYLKLPPRTIACMRFGGLVWGLAWLLLLAAAGIATRLLIKPPTAVLIGFAIVGGLVFINTILSVGVYPLIRYARYRYRMDADTVDVIEGLWFITRTVVPMERILTIAVSQGPIRRRYGLADVVVTTAGGNATIKYLEQATADDIAVLLKQRINRIIRLQNAMDDEGETVPEKDAQDVC